MDSSVSPKDEIWFLRVCHHIPNAVYSSDEEEKQYSLRALDYLLAPELLF